MFSSELPPGSYSTQKYVANLLQAAKAEDALNPEAKLMWAVLCELNKEGQLSHVNWEDVKGAIEASTAHAAR